jgi:hypothetical protein
VLQEMLWQEVLVLVQVLVQVLLLHAQVAGAGICAANLAERETTNPPTPACRRCPLQPAAPARGAGSVAQTGMFIASVILQILQLQKVPDGHCMGRAASAMLPPTR